MNQETFFENFELLADAPNGVQKLRELILQLAVQGKLVPHDPNDETAEVLFEKINAERFKLVNERKIKKKVEISIEEDEIPYKLPNNWLWVRLVHMFYPISTSNKKIKTSEIEGYGEYPVIDQGQLFIKGYTNNADLVIKLPSPVVVFGDHTCEIKFVDFDFVAGADGIKILCPIIVYGRYFYWVIRNIKLEDRGYSRYYKFLLNNLFPLPPLEEQKRIVAKVDQLMALSDELEARQQKKHEQRILLNNAALDELLTAPTPEEFAQHWQRICDNFDLLYDAPETVGEFRKAILQLAVQGKLVRQDANDEPAAVLMEKIGAEKESLVKEGKIRKQKAVPPVEGSDGLFELPENWQWDRFANVTLSSEAGWSPQCEKREREGNEWGVLKVSAVSWDVFKPHENKALPSSLEPRSQHEVKVGDFLLSRANTLELVAKSVVVEDSPPKLMMSDKLIRLHLSENVERRFFNIFNNCSTARGYYAKEASGTSSSMRNVSRECILKMPVPVPPLQEQRRIVAKVDQLMALCDELEAGLVQAQTEGGELMEAVVHHVLAG